MNFKKIILSVLSIFIFSTSGYAEDIGSALNIKDKSIVTGKYQMLQTLNELKNDIPKLKQIERVIQQILQIASLRLVEAGFTEDSIQIDSEWKEISTYYFSNSMSTLDLGDHTPLSNWLDKTYIKIENRLGEKFCSMEHLSDIRAINYGFPVVIHPDGDPLTNQPWGLDEYNLHFVPFATAVSYWSGQIACSVTLNFVGSTVCSIGLEIPRYAIFNYIAPIVGRHIYKKFNLIDDLMNLSSDKKN